MKSKSIYYIFDSISKLYQLSLFNIIKTLVNVLSFRNQIYENSSLDIFNIFI